jgi:hypothetical protein
MQQRIIILIAAAVAASAAVGAQQPYPGAPPAAPAAPAPVANPRAAAPIDITGYWVSMVTEDWRWRVVTPPKGDVLYLPVNPEGRKMAEAWDPAKDEAAGEQCKAFGAGGVMRIPGRLHITWENDQTLRLDTDAGTQTRRFHFGQAPPATEPSWQGRSIANWQMYGPPARGRAMAAAPLDNGIELARGSRPRRGGELRVITRNMKSGYLRLNGVPYSENAVLTEHFMTLKEDTGDQYLVVTTILEDATYLAAPYVRSYQFKKQTDEKGWNPTPCSVK